uniref:Uncharacterized protein n=1 Tax=Cucumis melo TaxID=3656 RepID=A0A9I9EA61_CUCME
MFGLRMRIKFHTRLACGLGSVGDPESKNAGCSNEHDSARSPFQARGNAYVTVPACNLQLEFMEV